MAVTLKSKTKTTKKAVVAQQAVSTDIQGALMEDAADLVDLLAPTLAKAKVLETQLAKLNEEIGTTKKTILEMVKVMDIAPENKVTIVGNLATAEVSKDTEKREISDKDLLVETLDQIEEGLAIKLAKFLLGDVDKYLTPGQAGKVVSKHYSGTRTVKFK